MQTLEDNDEREHVQLGWGYWFKWVGVSVATLTIIGAVIGYILPEGTLSKGGIAIFGGAAGAVVGAILGAITGAIRAWMFRKH
jgi:flagellar motor component MotA